jgi:hypothetical protein
MFDDGGVHNCDKPVSYLQQLGIMHIDFHQSPVCCRSAVWCFLMNTLTNARVDIDQQ